MYVFLAVIVLAVAAGVALFARMGARDEPLLGVYGLVCLCIAGLAGSAYGVLSSG